MSTVQIFVTRKIPEPGLLMLRDAGVEFSIAQEQENAGLDPAELAAGVANASVLLSLLTEKVDRTLLESAPGLLGVANMAVGFDNIDVAAATQLGIPVSNTPGVLTESTADLTWAMILGVARRIPQAHRYMCDGEYKIWGPNLFLGSDVGPGPDARKKVLGIVGYGRIGAAVARRARGFDMRVIAYDPHNRAGIAADPEVEVAEDLTELLANADFVSLHPLLSPETQHMIGSDELRAMKPGAFLVNASRGPVVDEEALLLALREGWIAGAALDVYEREPEMVAGLEALPNVMLLPHIASATWDTRGRMASMAAENALCHLRGEKAPNVVNPEVYETDEYRTRRQLQSR
ncbi:MAG: 2-hydroxyacid dehydrogenase [Planctomycetota bacterium]|jgi:glyoxylate reductase